MCNCKTKVQFEVDGGSLFDIEAIENNNCQAFNECLYCTEIEDKLDDGVYNAILNCEVYPVQYSECVEYEGENILSDIVKLL